MLDNGTFAINRSDIYTFGGVISGTGSFVQSGSGTTVLTGRQYLYRRHTVNAGTLQLGPGGNLAPTGALDRQAGGTFDLNGSTRPSATFPAQAWSRWAAARSLPEPRNSTIFAGAISGTGVFTKAGTGTLMFTGASTYTGATSINAGTLVVNGSIANSAVIVNSGAMLAGTGTVGATTINTAAHSRPAPPARPAP